MFERIGRYRVERLLGTGAFATVWLAVDESLDAQVAVKVLAENWMHDEDVRRRFAEEARILWRLDSDRIIRVHIVDEMEDGRPYFVMDYADGGNLEDRMRDRAQKNEPYSVDEAVALSIAIADGLAVAHRQGIVHRDLKPSNVMFRRAGSGEERVVLADFGIARSLEAAGATTISAGTPHYMAPEQTEGRADRGSDVYAAAVVLYELLAGRVPFPYPSAGQVMRAQLTEAAPDVRSVRPDVPAALATVVASGLESEPANRYATAEAWRHALDSAVGTDEVHRPVAPPVVMADAGETLGPAELASARAGGGELGNVTPPPVPGPGGGPGNVTPPPSPGRGGGPGAPPPEPRRRRRRPVVPVLVALIVIAALIAGISILSAGKASAGEIFRDPAGYAGLSPFMGSLVPPSVNPPSAPPLSVPPLTLPQGAGASIPSVPGGAAVIPSVVGASPGLYGGTRQLSVCDAKAMVDFLTSNADKAAAWARVEGIPVDQLPSYIGSLTDTILRSDTRVTNHGFANGVATPHQSILQAGTAVLVDAFGVPRARCFCGNPLLPPIAVKSSPKYTGPTWPGFNPTNVTVIVPGPRVTTLVLVDVHTGVPFSRQVGTHGSADSDAPAGVGGTSTTTSPPTTAAPTTTAPSTTSTTTTPPTTAPPQPNTDITHEGTVAASSTFSGFSTQAAVDGDPTTSWFSNGIRDPNGNFAIFTWQGQRDDLIGRIKITGNEQNSNPSFRTGEGFLQTEVQVLDAGGTVVFDQTFPGPGRTSPDVVATPNVVGRTVRLKLSGHEDPQCGGFGELSVLAVR